MLVPASAGSASLRPSPSNTAARSSSGFDGRLAGDLPRLGRKLLGRSCSPSSRAPGGVVEEGPGEDRRASRTPAAPRPPARRAARRRRRRRGPTSGPSARSRFGPQEAWARGRPGGRPARSSSLAASPCRSMSMAASTARRPDPSHRLAVDPERLDLLDGLAGELERLPVVAAAGSGDGPAGPPQADVLQVVGVREVFQPGESGLVHRPVAPCPHDEEIEAVRGDAERTSRLPVPCSAARPRPTGRGESVRRSSCPSRRRAISLVPARRRSESAS